MGRMTIRALRPDETIPDAEPKRYLSSHGYVRLRWRVGVDEYVEAYEHRLVMGRPTVDVHHLDHDKANNDPANLVALDQVAHARLHADQQRGRWRGRARDRARQARRAERELLWATMAAEHAAGASTVALGLKYGRHPSNISRGLHARGYPVRPRPGS